MTESLNTLDNLEQLRERVRWSMSAIYLTYFVFWVSSRALPLDARLLDARTWLAGLAVLVLATVLLPSDAPLRSRKAMGAVVLVAALALILLMRQSLAGAEHLGGVLVWWNVVILLAFLAFNSLSGLTVAGILLLALVSLFLTGQRPSSADMQVLLAGLFSAVSVTALGFLTMRFIEQHLMLHEETTDQLAAARKDALTGVLGRAALEEELRRTIQHARKTATPLSVIVTDIDHFKRVNDGFGHGAGDDVLRSFAKRLRRNVGGSGGVVGRWGGEEFVVVLPGLARPDALVMAERLRQEVSHAPVASHQITASFGVASFRSAADDLDTLFGRADARLYEAKNAGRNAVRG